MEKITSIKDDRIVLARSLKTQKGRLANHKILLEGEQIIDWANKHGLSINFIFTIEKITAEIKEKLESFCCPLMLVSEGIIKKITDTNYLIPMVGVADMPSNSSVKKQDFVVVLDDLNDAGNIGTIIRTCQAFGVMDIFSTVPDFDIYQRKIIDASRGSAFSANLNCFSSPHEAIASLKSSGYQIIATSPRGRNLQSLLQLKSQPVALVVGNESKGVHPEFERNADFLVQIPMANEIESLNVGVATGISIYEIKLQQVLAMIEQRIKSTLGREINVAATLIQQTLDAELHRVSTLTSQQVVFMMVLKCDQHMTVEGICRQFGVLETKAGDFLAPLLVTGLVAREKDDFVLTDLGEQTLAKLWPIVERTERKLLSDFSPEEVALFISNLQKIQKKSMEIVERTSVE